VSAASAGPGTHVALLRGINVGKAKRIAMADLRALVESLGYGDVRTLLNSGNVVFDADVKSRGDAAARIESAIETQLGVTSRVIVVSSSEIAEIVDANPLLDIGTNHSRLMVTVLNSPADTAKLEPLLAQRWAPEAIALGTRVAYAWYPDGIIDSAIAKAVSKLLGDAATTRNWATMMKVHAMTIRS
jgi:uncharacterized protein (DUF1697 family)